jgi:predicted AlkP superfamily pyrophosphatase or phosphodiesterase
MKSFLILYTLFIFNILISIYFFTNGFLIRRLSLNNTNHRSYPNLKRFDKAIILFVDALRFDFIFSNKTDYFGLPTIETLIRTKKSNAKLFKFIADVSIEYFDIFFKVN